MNQPGKPPRWDTRDQREREALKRWTAARLEQERAARLIDWRKGWLTELATQYGNFQPLRAFVQERLGFDLAPYLRPRKRSRGEYERRERPWAVERAVIDVKIIRAIWKANFDGHWKRSDDLAVEIATERWAIDQEEIHRALKANSGK